MGMTTTTCATSAYEKIWLKNYPAGIPAEIGPSEYRSLAEFFDKVCQQHPQAPAFNNYGVAISYTDLNRQARDFAAYLQSLSGMSKGERVAIMMPNLIQYPVALFGVLMAGMTVVNVNPLYTARELQHQLKDSGSKAIVVVENFAKTLQEVLAETEVQHVITTQIGDCQSLPKRWLMNFVIKKIKKMVPSWKIDHAVDYRQALRDGTKRKFDRVDLQSSDIAFLQYTGGTTGVAKGAVLTHANILANIEQVGGWLSRAFQPAGEIAILPLPMYHIFCLTAMLSFFKWNAQLVLITNPRDMPAFIKELARWHWSVFIGVNTLFNGLLNTPGFEQLDFTSIKVVVGGGAAVQQAVAERWQKATGHCITTAYGLTETSPGVTANPVGEPWNGSIGMPFPSTEVSIRDDDFNELTLCDGTRPIDECTGEICVRGPQVMAGYWQRPEETAQVMRGDWLLTGDIGHMDMRGYVTVTDRKKDMIKVSGFNVYPNEIEDVVMMHAGVLECAVVGVPDAKTGEAVKLVVVRKDPALTEAMLLEHCKTNLTGYKRPKLIEFRDSLPKTPIGKVLRRELRN